MDRPLVPMSAEAAAMSVGKLVHVLGWNKGCVLRLLAIDGQIARLATPRTNRPFSIPVSRLAYARADEPQE